MKKIYVIGHKNPDTDSIVSSIAYAALKQELGEKNVFPARGGKVNLQTEYILKRFNVPQPEFVSDLVPRVKHHMSGEPVTLPHELLSGGNAGAFQQQVQDDPFNRR
jgi:manganese-dependent inorganic pyrophosphatase